MLPRVVEPHVARGHAPQRRRAVEDHALQAIEGGDVGGPAPLVDHVVHPRAVLAAHANSHLRTGELVCKTTK